MKNDAITCTICRNNITLEVETWLVHFSRKELLATYARIRRNRRRRELYAAYKTRKAAPTEEV
ncbi:hypothetical protein [Geomonas edaphica]|uniref:hypothetical protein n=1 Tax=Geomonas edaphica TaxID=2570226 RepID=UPI0010A769BA|nr:hypothetical protein [Geomonas edaphica]